MEENKTNEVTISEKSLEILVAKFIPTSQYFERSFEMLQEQLREQKEELRYFKADVDKRFEQVDKRFEQVDKRFEQVDKRFEQVDKRFEQVNKRFEQVDKKIEKLTENIQQLTLEVKELGKKQEVTLREYIIERDRFYDNKFNNLRMFNIAIISVVAGIILKMVGILHI